MTVYEMKNGGLYRDGKQVFPVGQSYYPSFHFAKYPVPPDGDRIGEARKDLRRMADVGFNLVRFASLGEVTLTDGKVCVDTPFVDEMLEECERDGLAATVRLQGYDVNLRGFENVRMLDCCGEPQEDRWADFIRTTFFHEGILEDNRVYAEAKAAHYKQFPAVVGTLTYNEPHLPAGRYFDYHPTAIAAFRKYLTERGVLTPEEAEHYEPPRTRKEQTPELWATWRVFMLRAMTAFLKNAADAAKKAGLPTFTCLTDASLDVRGTLRGADYFGIARVMDLSGYNSYIPAMGVGAYDLNLLADLGVCAGELAGKPAWCVELDARTSIPPAVFNKNVYTVLGAGTKGIVFYQWRGDYPAVGTPHPNSCGFLNYDGTETANFDNGVRMVALLNRYGDRFVAAKRIHTGVGLLHSMYANAYCDAIEYDAERSKEQSHSLYTVLVRTVYRDLREMHQHVTVTDAEALRDDPCGIRTLFVPYAPYLSDEEKRQLDAFRAAGGTVYECCSDRECALGYRPYGKEMGTYDPYLRMRDIPLPTPPVTTDDPDALVQTLADGEKRLIFVTNIRADGGAISPILRCDFPCGRATVATTAGERELKVQDGCITADGIEDGCVIFTEP